MRLLPALSLLLLATLALAPQPAQAATFCTVGDLVTPLSVYHVAYVECDHDRDSLVGCFVEIPDPDRPGAYVWVLKVNTSYCG